METQLYTGTLVVVTCGECGTTFGMDERFHRERREDHATFYCPNGHPRAYLGKSDMERERDQARAQAQFYREYGELKAKDAEQAKRSAAANRGVVTKLKRRISRGVCPCCNRTFADLGRHMAGQHPEFSAEES